MRRAVSAAVAGAFLLVGCSAAPGPSSESTVAIPPPRSSPPSPGVPAPDDAPSAAAIPECPVEVAEGIERTVAAQLEAFAARDFRAALALASESFRAATDVKSFRKVILTGYPEVAAAIDHRLVECRQPGPRGAAALVDVMGGNGVTARVAYRLVLEPRGWRIDGASTLGTQRAPTA